MSANERAAGQTGIPRARQVATRTPLAEVDDDGALLRVLPWSGPDGWRDARPLLVPRDTSLNVHGRDAGFSLIELMVALLVMAILLGIAIPTFLGTTGAAEDRSAQMNLVTALTAAKLQFQNGGETYDINGSANAGALSSALEALQPELHFEAGSPAQGSSDSQADISVAVSTDGVGVVLAAYSVPDNCYYVVDNTGTLSRTSYPYIGTTVTMSSQPVSGALGLPIAVGTSYVAVSGDTHTADCNAFRPAASVPGTTALYQLDGFPA